MSDEINSVPSGQSETNAEKRPASVSFKQELYFYLQNLVYGFLVIILLFIFIGRLIPVEGDSMQPTLYDGDMMLLQSILYEPHQGDVVVLDEDNFHEGVPIVKRVIAVGGQTVKIDYDTNTVYVDGVALDEPYIKEAMINKYGSAWTTEAVIPEGYIFVMGDNRNNSDDSRNPTLGIVDVRRVIGHSICVLFPFSNFGQI